MKASVLLVVLALSGLPAAAGTIANVVSFGADPTGAKDSLPAATAAAKSLATSGGGSVCFPAGNYMFDSYTTDSSGDSFNLLTYSDNTVFEPCAGAAPGSVTIFQGPHGWGTAKHGVFGPISVFNTDAFLPSPHGMNGYQDPLQNRGWHNLNAPLPAGAASVTFSVPAEAANCPADGWIAISTSKDAGPITPLEINQVLSSNPSTGRVTLRWPQTVAYPTYIGGTAGVYAACVTHLLRQHVTIRGLNLRATAGVLLNDLYDIAFEDNHIQCDATYSRAKCPFLFANAVRNMRVTGNTFDHFPAGSGQGTGVDLADNNPIDLFIDGNTYDQCTTAGSEFAEHAIFSHNRLTTGGNCVFSGYDILVEANTFTASATQPYGQVADNSTAPNPYHFPFQGTRFLSNRIQGIGGGPGLNSVMILYQPDSQAIGNTIQATKGEIGLASQCCAGDTVRRQVIVNNQIGCDAFRGAFACVLFRGTALDAVTVTGNQIEGTGESTRGLLFQDHPAQSSGVLGVSGNTVRGFTRTLMPVDASGATCSGLVDEPARPRCVDKPLPDK